ncbi:MAG: PAS domain S-box protein [Bryobacteraceae bacterium]
MNRQGGQPGMQLDPVVIHGGAMTHTILSVDHDAAVGCARNQALREAGFEVIEAVTGAHALQLASEKQPALVVLAIELPGMDGIAVSKRLKSDPRTASIPVLHISSRGELSRCYPESLKSGAEAYLQAPVEPAVLIAVVTALIPADSGAARARKTDAPAKDALSALIDSIPDEIWFADTQGRFTLVNPSAGREFKIDAPALVGVEELARRLEVYRADGSPRPVEEAPPLRALRGETVRDLEEIVRTPGHGELRHRQVSASPVRDATGNIVGSVSVVRDITESKRAEEALRATTLFPEQNPAPVLRVGGDGALLYANPGSDVLLAEWKCQVGQLVPDDLRHAVEEALAQAAPAEFDVRAGGRDYSFVIAPVAAHRYANLFGRDLTQRKRAEAVLRESEYRLRTLGDNLPEGAIYRYRHDAGGEPHVDFISAGIEGLTGVPAAEFMADAAAVERSVAPEDRDRLRAAIAWSRERLTRFEVEVRHVHRATGETRWSLLRSTPSRCPDGSTVWDGIELDITESRRAEEALRESEAVLRSFFDSPGMMRGIVELIDGRIVHVSCNVAAAAMYGVERESIAGKSAIEAGASEQVARSWVDLYAESWRTGKPVSMEYARRDADGQERWLLATAGYLGTGHSGSPRFAYTILDLTHRKLAEEALRDSEERFRAQVTASSDAVYRMSPDWSEMRQLRGRDFIADTKTPSRAWLQEYIHPDDQPRVMAAIDEAIRSKSVFELEHRVLRVDGTLGWTFSRAIPIEDANGEIVEWFGAASDITERRQAEEALRQSEKMYRAIGESIDYGVWVSTPDGRTTYASEAFLKLVGFTQERCSGFGWGEALHPDDAARTMAAWKECVRTEGRWEVEHRFRGVDGKWHPTLARAVPVRDEQGRTTCWVGINIDIGALKQTEDSLRESESRERARAVELEALMAAAPAVIFVAHDPKCRYMTGNRMTYDLLRTPSGSNLSKSAPDGEKPTNFRLMKDGIEIPPPELPVQKAASTGQPVRDYELDFVFEDGSSGNLLGDAVPMLGEDGRPRGAVGVFVDITERKRAEASLREAQKLESLGLLAGGVAHDFNNLLVGVIGNASLALELLTPGHPATELLDGVIKTGQQAAHLTRQMLAYAGKGKFLVEALNLSALIPEMAGLIRTSISKKIALQLDLEEDLPPIQADCGQVQQVFMNLALNAAEAIGSYGGLITIKTGVQDVDDRYIRFHPEAAALPPEKYVYLEVRDTGCGMDDATRARIFDPFFSTKFTGRGLGLAAVAGILRGHQGAIAVSTAPGKGSCFTVLFPAAARVSEERPAAPRSTALRGSGVVVVVDDEKLVREMMKKVLERYGYTVLLAESGLAAMDLLRRHPGDIALVVLDLSMPRMSGEEALPELRKIRPEVKILVSSGYNESETMTMFKGQRVSGFIQKPFTGVGLAEKVKVCLG